MIASPAGAGWQNSSKVLEVKVIQMDNGSFSKVISLKISGTWPSNSEVYNPYLGSVSSNVFTDFSRSGPYVILLNYDPLNYFTLYVSDVIIPFLVTQVFSHFFLLFYCK